MILIIIIKLSFLLLVISCELVCSWNESFSWSKSYRLQKHDAAFSSRTNKLSPPGKVYILWLFVWFDSENLSLIIITVSRLEEAKWSVKLFSECIIKQLTLDELSRQLSPILWTSSGLFKQDYGAWTSPNALSLLWWLY